MKKKSWKKICTIAIVLAFLYLLPLSALAKSEMLVVGTACLDETMKVYVKNPVNTAATSLQIGSEKGDIAGTYKVTEDKVPIRTLILFECTGKITGEDQARVKSLVGAIMDGAADGEQFRVAAYANDLSYITNEYSNEYQNVKESVDKVNFSGKDVSLLVPLKQAVEDQAREAYQGYRRIIVIGSGCENDRQNLQEVQGLLSEQGIPVYTVGCKTEKSNKKDLKRMAGLSKNAFAEHFVLSDSGENLTPIVTGLAKDYGIQVYEAKYPNGSRNGSRVTATLYFGEKEFARFDVVIPQKQETEKPAAGPQPEAVGLGMGVAAFLVLLALLALLKRRQKPGAQTAEAKKSGAKKPEEKKPETEKSTRDRSEAAGSQEHTQRSHAAGKPKDSGSRNSRRSGLKQSGLSGKTEGEAAGSGEASRRSGSGFSVAVPGGGLSGQRPAVSNVQVSDFTAEQSADLGELSKSDPRMHDVALLDENDGRQLGKVSFQDEVLIGRSEECHLAITFEQSISARHCRILAEQDGFFVEDLGSTNRTRINGVAISSKSQIRSGDKLTMGRITFVVQFS